jgi:membrane protease YdiL (CAAX protease family)
MESVVERPSPDSSGSPEGGEPEPRWPAWYGGVAFIVALVGTVVALGIVAAATGTTSEEDATPTFTIVATFLQDAIFVATAVLFASFVLRPRPWHFGLRATKLWPAVRLAGLGLLSFYGFSALYAVALHPDVDQTITQDLGADTGTVGLIVAGVMVVCVAPAAEEFFFRGFFYKALRSRFRVAAAAVIDGIFFGVIHYDFSGADALLIVPPLAVLGFIFCLVYEQTGSLYPVIALHAINNSVAYAVQADGEAVSAVLGPLVVVACIVIPWLAPRAAPSLR